SGTHDRGPDLPMRHPSIPTRPSLSRGRLTVALLLTLLAPLWLVQAAPAHADALTAVSMLSVLPVRADDTSSYNRGYFQHWIDADDDGCDTRREVLIDEATVAPTIGAGCSLTGGSWYSAYDGAATNDPSTFDIDHMVPLHEAWVSGAADWSSNDRKAFA